MATEEGVAQREEARLAGLELRHSVISVRPLVGARVGALSLSNSSDASLSTFLYLRGGGRETRQPGTVFKIGRASCRERVSSPV